MYTKEVVMCLQKLGLLHLRISPLDQPVEDVHFAVQKPDLCDLTGHVPFVTLDYALEKQRIVSKDITEVIIIRFNDLSVICIYMFFVDPT